MKIEAYARHGNIGFVVKAETESERALLSFIFSGEYQEGRKFMVGGHTYECDHSATTSFSFSWVKDK